MHVPAEVARRAVEVAVSTHAEACVAVGGGSAVGLGKAIALELGLPVVAVPTTYAGSEMTPVWGLAGDGVKPTGGEQRVQPGARGSALYAAWLCGSVLGATTMGLHHKLCHVLGGTLGLPHAATHTVVLPHVVAFNATAAPGMIAAISRALGAADPSRRLWDL